MARRLGSAILLSILPGMTPLAKAQTVDTSSTAPSASDKLDLGLRIDCATSLSRHAPSTQACLNLSGLGLQWRHRFDPQTQLTLRLDPFGTPATSMADQPRLTAKALPGPNDTSLGIVDHYQILWQAHPDLALSLESFTGTTWIPNMSELAFGNALQDGPWKQSALVARYHLHAGLEAKITLALGNGEGESTRNMDPQSYGGARLELGIAPGFWLIGAYSLDGNSAGSETDHWLYERDDDHAPRLGFATERLASAFVMDGTWKHARGLTLAIGWQRTRYRDLDQGQQAIPPAFLSDNPRGIDASYAAFEANDTRLVTNHEHLLANAAYRILAQYFIGISYETRYITTQRKLPVFQICQSLEGGCQAQAATSSLGQKAYSVGMGMDVSEALRAILEYQTNTYDKLYRLYHFPGHGDQGERTRRIANARLSYHW